MAQACDIKIPFDIARASFRILHNFNFCQVSGKLFSTFYCAFKAPALALLGAMNSFFQNEVADVKKLNVFNAPNRVKIYRMLMFCFASQGASPPWTPAGCSSPNSYVASESSEMNEVLSRLDVRIVMAFLFARRREFVPSIFSHCCLTSEHLHLHHCFVSMKSEINGLRCALDEFNECITHMILQSVLLRGSSPWIHR